MSQPYTIHLDEKYGFLTLIDTPQLVSEVKEDWFNQSLCRINDCVARVGVFKKGEFHFHKHDNEDELFFVLQGELIIEVEKEPNQPETIVLRQHQGYTIPKGVVHRTRVEEPVVVLMVEGGTVVPTGDK